MKTSPFISVSVCMSSYMYSTLLVITIILSSYSKEMFSYKIYSSVPVQGGRLLAGQGWEGGVGVLAETDGRIVWGGENGTYYFDENCNKWEGLADSSKCKATLAMCGGCLVYVGGTTSDGLCMQ